MSRKFVLWDIDNCIADDRHRVPLIDWHLDGNERYMRYNEHMLDDEPCNVHLFDLFLEMGMTPVFFTGRPEIWRGLTEAYLDEWFLDGVEPYAIYMRGNDERLTPADLKQRMLRDFLKTHELSDIACAFDDHEAIVRMYRSHGVAAAVLKVHDVPIYNAADQADATPLTL